VLRNTTRWMVAGIYLLFAAAGVVFALRTTKIPEAILFVLGAAVFTILGVRAARSAIWISDQGVTARGDRFTRHLSWGEIERFEIRPRRSGGLGSTRGLGARRLDGQWIRLMDYGVDSQNRYPAALRELQAELGRRRQP
jgi:hypothetical protein